jgi:ATP-binding cassette subfamily B (MDR/TAP) protein 1
MRSGDALDIAMIATCAACAVGAGIAMPLMFLIFGRLVGDFTDYFTPSTTVTKEKFLNGINRNAYVDKYPATNPYRMMVG